MPPRSRNHLEPTGPDTPTAIPAPSLVIPSAILRQNSCSSSRRIGGRTGDRSAGRPVCVTIHPGCRPINTSTIGVLLRLVEPGQYTSVALTERLIEAGADPSVGTVGDALDNALAETTVGSFKTELIRRHGPWRDIDHVEIQTLTWVDFFNNDRPHEYLDDLTPTLVENLHYHRTQQTTPVG